LALFCHDCGSWSRLGGRGFYRVRDGGAHPIGLKFRANPVYNSQPTGRGRIELTTATPENRSRVDAGSHDSQDQNKPSPFRTDLGI
jgi:hypothetical protein